MARSAIRYVVEVVEKDGTHLVLRVTPEEELDPDVPERMPARSRARRTLLS
jgi:hypothetical protein